MMFALKIRYGEMKIRQHFICKKGIIWNFWRKIGRGEKKEHASSAQIGLEACWLAWLNLLGWLLHFS